MTTLTITSKGQVTLRKDVLKHLGVEPGQKVSVDKLPDGRIEVRAVQQTHDIADAYGILAPKNKNKNNITLTLEDIEQLAQQGWASEK